LRYQGVILNETAGMPVILGQRAAICNSETSISVMHNYSSFLIRHWLLEGDSDDRRQVFDIEHVHSGRRTRLGSLNEAQTWIEAVSMEARELRDEADSFEQSREVSGPGVISAPE
jgi:hypothetical protein